MNHKQLLNNIMAKVPQIIKEELDDEIIAPKKKLDIRPQFVVECTYIDKSIIAKLDLYRFPNERLSSGIRIFCVSWDAVIKVISILEQYKALEKEVLYGKEYGSIRIYKWRSAMNDSIIEKVNEGRSYKENINPKGETPRAHAKREAMRAVRNGDLARDPEVIKQYLLDTGLWDDISDMRLRLDVKFVMDKSEGWDQEISGDFITEFIYSQDSETELRGRVISEEEALNMHIQYLIDNGLTVETKPGRYATKLYIHYDNKKQYEALVKWAMWDMGMVESIQNGGRASADRKRCEEIIASGKAPMCF